MIGAGAVLGLSGRRHHGLTIDVPAQLRRVLFVEIYTHLWFVRAAGSAFRGSGTLEVISLVLMERVCVQVTFLGH